MGTREHKEGTRTKQSQPSSLAFQIVHSSDNQLTQSGFSLVFSLFILQLPSTSILPFTTSPPRWIVSFVAYGWTHLPHYLLILTYQWRSVGAKSGLLCVLTLHCSDCVTREISEPRSQVRINFTSAMLAVQVIFLAGIGATQNHVRHSSFSLNIRMASCSER